MVFDHAMIFDVVTKSKNSSASNQQSPKNPPVIARSVLPPRKLYGRAFFNQCDTMFLYGALDSVQGRRGEPPKINHGGALCLSDRKAIAQIPTGRVLTRALPNTSPQWNPHTFGSPGTPVRIPFF